MGANAYIELKHFNDSENGSRGITILRKKFSGDSPEDGIIKTTQISQQYDG